MKECEAALMKGRAHAQQTPSPPKKRKEKNTVAPYWTFLELLMLLYCLVFESHRSTLAEARGVFSSSGTFVFAVYEKRRG